MMLKEFYAKYNLNHECFARMAHVGVGTLRKCAKGVTIRDDAKERIEYVMRIIEANDLVRPKREGDYGHWRRDIYQYENELRRHGIDPAKER